MTQNKNDYLRFSASSMVDLLKQKLTESKFTDQIFPGSNLATIIDVLAYLFSLQTYYLNTTASEAIFTDASLFENLNRIVKMLGYNPLGFVASITSCSMTIATGKTPVTAGGKIIPRFTTFETGLTDSAGNSVKYSLVEDYRFIVNNEGGGLGSNISSNFIPTLYNGEWKLYNTVPVAVGIPFEVITLENIVTHPAETSRVYLSHNHMYVYTKDSNGLYTEWKPTDNLYNYTSTDYYFEIRVNENYQYTLKFGDNINGRRLTVGDEIYIIYLESNGIDGQIGANIIEGTGIIGVNGLNDTVLKNQMLASSSTEYAQQYIQQSPLLTASARECTLDKIVFVNTAASTFVKDFETVDEIRVNAPNRFRMGSRLITEQDFTQFILSNWSTEVHDVKVMNNWEYMCEFQQW